MAEVLKPHIEERQIDGTTYFLAHGMSVGSFEEQMDVVTAPIYEPYGEKAGKLIPIGGAASEKNFRVLSGEVVNGTGVAVVSFPTMLPEKRHEDIAIPLEKNGVTGPVFHVKAGLLPDIGKLMFERSSLIMVTGGDQLRGKRLLEKTGLGRELLKSHVAGKTIAGTSAGAHLMGDKMPRGEGILDGLGLTHFGIDTHFGQMDRYGRQERFVEETDEVSIGLDEGTGVIYEGGKARVFGKGEAVIRYHNGRMEDPVVLREGEEVDISGLNQYIGSF
jgi:cyanophycinase